VVAQPSWKDSNTVAKFAVEVDAWFVVKADDMEKAWHKAKDKVGGPQDEIVWENIEIQTIGRCE
jgi:hypothetical protein